MANILVFGNSIAQGHYDLKGGWVDRVKQYCIQKSLKSNHEGYYEVFNLGRAGDTTDHLIKRFDNEIKVRYWEDPITVIIFEIGFNDSIILYGTGKNKVSKEEFKNNLNKIINLARKYSNKIIFLGLTPIEEKKVNPMPWNTEQSYIEKSVKDYDLMIQQFCKDNNSEYIYLYDKLTISHLEDGAHPNTKGHEMIFKTVKSFLEEKGYI